MKLCRFELVATPGEVRSGIVYNGKVYETDGANAVAVHEAEAIRPLPPVGLPPSARLFRSGSGGDVELLAYTHLNAANFAGPSTALEHPSYVAALSVVPCLVAVLGGEGMHVPVEDADDAIIGYTLALLLTSLDEARAEREAGYPTGRSLDLGAVLGPVLTTPDEMEDLLVDDSDGRTYGVATVLRVNGVERMRGQTHEMRPTFARMISHCSAAAPVRSGDLFLLGPVADSLDEPVLLAAGDEVQFAVGKLGTLAMSITEEVR